MKRLRVAMVMSYDPSKMGGVQVHIYELSRALEARGHAVTVFGPDTKPVLPFRSYVPIGQLIRAPSLYGSWSNIMVPKEGFEDFAKIIPASRFDVCHVHDVTVPSVAWGILSNVSVPRIVTFHSTWDDGSWMNVFNIVLRLLRVHFSSKVSGVISVSKATARKWRNLYARHVLSRVIHNGVSPEFAPDPAKRDPRVVTLLFVARLVPNKGLMHLLSAFDIIARDYPHLRVEVVGSGTEREEAEAFVRGHRLGKRVSFLGELTGRKRTDAYARADVFCAPYVDEAFGLTVLEAMASGLPVVGFTNDSIGEILGAYPGKRFLVSRGDIHAFARALAVIAERADLRSELGAWCRTESGRYTWEDVAAETESVYRDAVRRARHA